MLSELQDEVRQWSLAGAKHLALLVALIPGE
uniref:Uncharacterized protein n=1 Tax=Arundo donax TaxID=35708 RepID=A0A0A9CAL6_ARUDO